MFTVLSYVRPDGTSPYEELLDQVERSGDRKARARIQAYVLRLREHGFRLPIVTDWAEHLEGDLYEPRPKPYRLLYYWDGDLEAYILLNGFRKRSHRTPRAEIARGLALIAERGHL